ncbi:MAG: alpha/beta hydrolase [Variovorax sp.]|nr:MAG: alpha/beta hydrolase [Variovorax sp.]
MSSKTIHTPDGETLSVREWLLEGTAPRAVVLIVHGLGEHGGRYAHVADWLNARGFAVRAHDHHGHGRSSGVRGGAPESLRLVHDLALVVDDTRRALPGVPLVLLGHSLGGLVAASFVARDVRPVDALVLSSPGLDPGLSGVQKGLLAVLSRLAPTLRVGNGLNPCDISHDVSVVQAYRADPLNHDRIGSRIAGFLADEGAKVQAAAPQWRVPTLLLYAGADRIVRPEGSQRFADAAAPSRAVTSVAFPALFHEIFNESDTAPVFAALGDWLDRMLPAR